MCRHPRVLSEPRGRGRVALGRGRPLRTCFPVCAERGCPRRTRTQGDKAECEPGRARPWEPLCGDRGLLPLLRAGLQGTMGRAGVGWGPGSATEEPGHDFRAQEVGAGQQSPESPIYGNTRPSPYLPPPRAGGSPLSRRRQGWAAAGAALRLPQGSCPPSPPQGLCRLQAWGGAGLPQSPSATCALCLAL